MVLSFSGSWSSLFISFSVWGWVMKGAVVEKIHRPNIIVHETRYLDFIRLTDFLYSRCCFSLLSYRWFRYFFMLKVSVFKCRRYFIFTLSVVVAVYCFSLFFSLRWLFNSYINIKPTNTICYWLFAVVETIEWRSKELSLHAPVNSASVIFL